MPPHARIGGLAPELAALADVVDRLFAEFENQLALPVISATVLRCRRDLDIAAGPALPELVERLARQRLRDLAGNAPGAGGGEHR